MITHLYSHFDHLQDSLTRYHEDTCDTHDMQRQQLDSYQVYHTPQSANKYATTPDYNTYIDLKQHLQRVLTLALIINSPHPISSTVTTYVTWRERFLPTPLFPIVDSPALIVHHYRLTRKCIRYANSFHKKQHSPLQSNWSPTDHNH